MAATVSHRYDVAHQPHVVVSRRIESSDSGHTIVALQGEFDAAAHNSLIATFDDAIARDDSDVVVDLAGVEFMGAGWIGTLVRRRASLEAQHREFTLRSPPRVLYRLLELCGLSYLIESGGTRSAGV